MPREIKNQNAFITLICIFFFLGVERISIPEKPIRKLNMAVTEPLIIKQKRQVNMKIGLVIHFAKYGSLIFL